MSPFKKLLLVIFIVSSVASVITSLAVLFVRSSAQQIIKCNFYESGNTPPEGFGAAWNPFTSGKELLLNNECQQGSVKVTAGSGGDIQYIYKSGYIYKDNKWSEFPLEGTLVEGTQDWFKGKATHTFSGNDLPPGALNWVGYVCQWDANANQWKCGCPDQACAVSRWQLQAADIKPVPSVTPTGSPSASITPPLTPGGPSISPGGPSITPGGPSITPGGPSITPGGLPTVTFTASPETIQPGQQATLAWSSTNATSCQKNDGWTGTAPITGSEVVSPTATTSYSLACTDGSRWSMTITKQVIVAANTPVPTAVNTPVPTAVNTPVPTAIPYVWKTQIINDSCDKCSLKSLPRCPAAPADGVVCTAPNTDCGWQVPGTNNNWRSARCLQ